MEVAEEVAEEAAEEAAAVEDLLSGPEERGVLLILKARKRGGGLGIQ